MHILESCGKRRREWAPAFAGVTLSFLAKTLAMIFARDGTNRDA